VKKRSGPSKTALVAGNAEVASTSSADPTHTYEFAKDTANLASKLIALFHRKLKIELP
jgi:hypothetical protein